MPSKRRWLREPLLHFLGLGLAVFGLERLVAVPGGEPLGVISLDARAKQDLAARWEQRRGRAPAPEELARAEGEWVESEILFREGLRLGLHHSDALVRERIVDKMRFVLSHAEPIEPPAEAELRRWFEENRRLYQRPARFDFAQVLVAGTGPAEQTRAEGHLAALRAGKPPETLPEGVREYRERTRANVIALLGAELAAALEVQSAGAWHLQRSPRGFHLLRLQALRDTRPPAFEQLRAQVEEDWRARRRSERAGQAIGALRKTYQVAGGGT